MADVVTAVRQLRQDPSRIGLANAASIPSSSSPLRGFGVNSLSPLTCVREGDTIGRSVKRLATQATGSGVRTAPATASASIETIVVIEEEQRSTYVRVGGQLTLEYKGQKARTTLEIHHDE